MGSAISSLVAIFGMAVSGLGMGTSTVTQLHALRSPSAYSTPAPMAGQQCWLERGATLIPGTFAVVEHADRSKTLECVTTAQESQR